MLLMVLVSFAASAQVYPRGDVNYDNGVDISDVTALIDYLLNGTWPDEPETEIFTVNGVSFSMVTVKGGTFMMGAAADDDFANNNERPAHEVTLSTFSIGQTEVTQELWMAVMGSNPSWYTSEHNYTDNFNRPVEQVSWYDCLYFISKLNELTGMTFRLPTEAEWEFAARGGNLSQGYKYAGSNNYNEVVIYWDTMPSQTEGTEGYGPQPVCTMAPNELGLYDMSGNVFEWCHDWYGSYSDEAQTNPQGPESGSQRVCRGGAWNHSHRDCRVSFRYSLPTSSAYSAFGLRLAL